MALDELVHGNRRNATIGWVLIGVTTLWSIESFLTNAILWGGFSLLVVATALVPALSTHDWTAMVPWPLLLVAAIAIIARATDVYAETTGYLAIATLALIIVVELDTFTPVDLSRRFAIVFAVLTTMAIQALWIIAQFYSDRWLGTGFLSSQTELQQDIVIVTIVGFALGGLFDVYSAWVGPTGASAQVADRGNAP